MPEVSVQVTLISSSWAEKAAATKTKQKKPLEKMNDIAKSKVIERKEQPEKGANAVDYLTQVPITFKLSQSQ